MIQFPMPATPQPFGAVLSKGREKLALGEPVGGCGSLSFWFLLPGPLSSGPGREKIDWTLLAAEGVFHFRVTQAPAAVGLVWTWEGAEFKAHDLRLLLPSLPGGQWLHWAATWDCERGIFDCALNGTPLRETGTTLTPWTHPAQFSSLAADGSHVALADIEATPGPAGLEHLCRNLPESVRGACDGMLGARRLGTWKTPTNRRVIYTNSLGEGLAPADWAIEGPARLEPDGSALRVSSLATGEDDAGHLVFWLRKELPSDFLAEWEIRPVSEHGLMIVFFAARGVNGEDALSPALAPRDGTFTQYHSGDINCYHISYYANTPAAPGRLTGNLRKNRGFTLVSNGPPGISAASRSWHKISLLKQAAHIRLAVDGEVKIDWSDDGSSCGPVLKGGKFGLRQMVWATAEYRNLTIESIEAN